MIQLIFFFHIYYVYHPSPATPHVQIRPSLPYNLFPMEIALLVGCIF